jgi:hypothetical protein
VEDFRRVFGAEPAEVAGVAVMTDTDNTGESVTAFYGTIVLDKEFSKPAAAAGPLHRFRPAALRPLLGANEAR